MKYAFMTMDVESFYDIECFKDRNLKYDKNFSFEESLIKYVNLLDKYNIKGTFFTLCSSLDIAKPYLNILKNNGHEIALHGFNHTSPLSMNEREFEESIIKSKPSSSVLVI